MKKTRIILPALMLLLTLLLLFTVNDLRNWVFENRLGVFMGLVLGCILDFAWYGIKKRRKIPKVIEHYHWGLGMWILSKWFSNLSGISPFTLGLGFWLILSESAQEHPFAYGSGHGKKSAAIGSGVLLVGLVILFVLPYFL